MNEKEGKERQRARVQTFRENIAFLYMYIEKLIVKKKTPTRYSQGRE